MASEIVFERMNALSWPSEVPTTNIQCAGSGYLHLLAARRTPLVALVRSALNGDGNGAAPPPGDDAAPSAGGATKKKKKEKDLLKVKDLTKLTHYEILSVPMSAAADDLKRAYHRACLRYHPDKTGRGEDDEVFLSIKEAHDVLSDAPRRRAYDSSVDFDDSIPKDGVSERKFYKSYGPVFERNLRFALNTRKGPGKKGREITIKPPPFGDDSASVEEVNGFYDYWTNFESWRDFSLVAEKKTEHDVESAECREEKRWMAKEIDRKAKQLKREEMARINTLVERAMAADPRLRRFRDNAAAEKERAAREKEEAAAADRRAEEEAAAVRRAAEEKRAELEKKKKGEERTQKDAAKKVLRKARNGLRKFVMGATDAVAEAWDSLEDADTDVELLCQKLGAVELELLAGEGPADAGDLRAVRQAAGDVREGKERDFAAGLKRRDAARAAAAVVAAEVARAAKMKEWSKAELVALTKAVKKYPPGGANRWEAIAHYINSSLALDDLRTKEQCIAQYNEVNSRIIMPGAAAAATEVEDVWNDEQNQLLQKGLKAHPASMDKNERWTSIAKGVPGKTKKQCVERFKAIRLALKVKGGDK